MSTAAYRPCVAVVSPFLDKSHGSERIVVEWLSHLPAAFEIHVYSQRVEGPELSKFVVHRIPELPGPHLFNFLWWFAANHLWIWWDRHVRGMRYDLIFSSGVNRFGADAICVHVVFAEYVRRVAPEMRLFRSPVSQWPRLLHRRLYYRLVTWMEGRVYTNPATTLVVNSSKTTQELADRYNRREPIPTIYLGIDHSIFNPERRAALREAARRDLGLAADQFAALLVGNDWRNKGGAVLLDALERLRELPIRLLVVSHEGASLWWHRVAEKGLGNRVFALPPRKDVEFYYAAADVYTGPSLQDSYGMPPAEAMACGLPVIVSAAAGVSEIITDGVDGLILKDPRDAAGLASMIRRLYEDEEFRKQLGERAAETTGKYTWESNGRELGAIFQEIVRRKSGFKAQTLTQHL